MSLHVEIIPALTDNYIYLLHDTISGESVVVDPGEAAPVLRVLGERQLKFIWNTHFHQDHTHGNRELKERSGCQVIGAAAERKRIAELDIAVEDGARWQWAGYHVRAFATPGHTRGALCFYVEEAGLLFTGDTLFSLGCGRLFEGTPEQMWESLSKIARLPAETMVYCGHEYTAANARFAQTIDPHNQRLRQRQNEVAALRAQGKPSLPVSLGEELATNPFLRAHDEGVRAQLKMAKAEDWRVFARIRELKDQFT